MMMVDNNPETLVSIKNMDYEGEISDDISIEEITEEDFGSVSSKLKSEVYMEDLLDYSVSRNKNDVVYHDFLVQDKKLVVIDDDSSDESEESICKIEEVIDELEEGEIEEGEIDELDVVVVDDDDVDDGKDESDGDNFGTKDMELDDESRISSELTNVTVNEEDEKSFAGVCIQYLDSLQLMVCSPGGEVLFQKFFSGIQALNTVFSTMEPAEKQENKFVFERLLTYVKSQGSGLFPTECMKEIDVMIHSLDPPFNVSNVEACAIGREVLMNNEAKELVSSVKNLPLQDLSSLKKLDLQAISVKPKFRIEINTRPKTVRIGLTSCSTGNGGFGPLLDLHRHHDMDSLPSPTRQILPPYLIKENQAEPNLPAISGADKPEDIQLCKIDVLKVVSTHRPKFGQESVLMSDQFPSPTASREVHGGNGDGDAQEVSNLVSSAPFMVSSAKETLVVGTTGLCCEKRPRRRLRRPRRTSRRVSASHYPSDSTKM